MRNKKSNNRTSSFSIVHVVLLLFCAVLITTNISSGIYARYKTETGDETDTRVAKFSVSTNLESFSQALDLTGIKPGSSESITVTVTNDSEVSVHYEFNAVTMDNLPLKVEWSDSCKGDLHVGGSKTASHTLTITWDSTKNSASYSKEVDAVILTLVCEQID